MRIKPGRFYQDGREVQPTRDADVWVCRRAADFTPTQIPDAAAFDDCGMCGARIVYNPARTSTAPRVCMQCAGIEPEALS
jgi:hypothetical protein